MGGQVMGISSAKTWYEEDKRKPKYEVKYTRGCIRKVKERKETVEGGNKQSHSMLAR
jgi:hypothetical protein